MAEITENLKLKNGGENSTVCCFFEWIVSATLIDALLAWSASYCSFRVTRSGRFCLRQMPHWVTASFAPLRSSKGFLDSLRAPELPPVLR